VCLDKSGFVNQFGKAQVDNDALIWRISSLEEWRVIDIDAVRAAPVYLVWERLRCIGYLEILDDVIRCSGALFRADVT
jgi:hypothetical protein